jgi:polar amino acid transport system substrate-binding protein
MSRLSDPVRNAVALFLALAAASVTLAACGDDSSTKTKSVALHAPDAVAKRGTLVFCSDISYPPEEFLEDGKPVGSDIDIGRELAKRMDVKADFKNTGFDGILDALEAKDCDAIISGMTDNAERRERVAFVDYLMVGQSLMVPTANEHDIEQLTDLAGLKVGVQSGTTNEEFLRAEAKKAEQWGDDGPPKVTTFDVDTKAAAALKDGTVDAYFGDSPAVAYYIGQEALTYAFAGEPINAEPIGIAVRKDDKELRKQLDRGIRAMYEDGTMHKLLKRWKLDGLELDE